MTALKRWLSTWSGIGHVAVGMERQGYAVSLRKLVDDGWTASFQEHALLAPAGRASRRCLWITRLGSIRRGGGITVARSDGLVY